MLRFFSAIKHNGLIAWKITSYDVTSSKRFDKTFCLSKYALFNFVTRLPILRKLKFINKCVQAIFIMTQIITSEYNFPLINSN